VPPTEEAPVAPLSLAALPPPLPPPAAAPPVAIKMDHGEENLDNLGPEELELLTDNLEDMCKVCIMLLFSSGWGGQFSSVADP
jgi:hypothetical protein